MKINEKFFESIDNYHKAYWLGFISNFGVIENELIVVKAGKKDEMHLRKFIKETDAKNQITTDKNGNFYIKIKNNIANDKLPENLMIDYWRGVIDASGTLSDERKELKISGRYDVCKKFLKFCKKFINTKSKVYKNKYDHQLRIHGDMALRIAQILYSNSALYLERNYKIYNKWEQFYTYKPLFPDVVKFFHKVIPQKFSVKRCKITSSLEGDCCYKENKYFIRINNNLNDKESVNCLLHELAHIDTMIDQEDLHGPAFGVAYSKIYKLYEAQFTS